MSDVFVTCDTTKKTGLLAYHVSDLLCNRFVPVSAHCKGAPRDFNLSHKNVKSSIPNFVTGPESKQILLDEKLKKARQLAEKQKKLQERENKKEDRRKKQEEEKLDKEKRKKERADRKKKDQGNSGSKRVRKSDSESQASRGKNGDSGIEVSNEEEYSILRILYCYSLQQHILLAFCNDCNTHYRQLAYILLRNIVIPEMTSEANWAHSPLFHGREHGNVQNYKL